MSKIIHTMPKNHAEKANALDVAKNCYNNICNEPKKYNIIEGSGDLCNACQLYYVMKYEKKKLDNHLDNVTKRQSSNGLLNSHGSTWDLNRSYSGRPNIVHSQSRGGVANTAVTPPSWNTK